MISPKKSESYFSIALRLFVLAFSRRDELPASELCQPAGSLKPP